MTFVIELGAHDGELESKPEPSLPGKRALGIERTLAGAAALVAVGFFLLWLDPRPANAVSGFDVASIGGVWSVAFAIPAFALLTVVLGGLQHRLSRYTGALTAIAIAAPTAVGLAFPTGRGCLPFPSLAVWSS